MLVPGGIIAFSSPISIHAMDLINIARRDLLDPPPFPLALPAMQSNRITTASDLLQNNGFDLVVVEEVTYDAPMDNPKMAAEACSPLVMNVGKGWDEEKQAEVMESLKVICEREWEAGRKEFLQNVLITVGKKRD